MKIQEFLRKVARRVPGGTKLLDSYEDEARARRYFQQGAPRIALREELLARRGYTEVPELVRDILFPHQIKEEIQAFLEFAGKSNPKVVCEIGTAEGGTHFLLNHGFPPASKVIGVDLFVRNSRILQDLSGGADVLHVNAPSADKSTVAQVAGFLEGHPIDVLFIDGDHTWSGVRADFLSYRSLVRPGGIIAFHDIAPDYETRFGRRSGNWAGDVPAFWKVIRTMYDFREFIKDPGQDAFGIGAIVYDPERSGDLPEAMGVPVSLP